MKKTISILGMLLLFIAAKAKGGTIFTDISDVIGNSGVAAMGDVNGDGWVDFLGCGGILLNKGEIVDGKPTFQCVTEGLDFVGESLNHPVFADIDGDGDQDLIVAEAYGDARLYRNDSCVDELHFVDITDEAGLGGNIAHEQTHIALADIDADGDLDAYLTEGWPYGYGGVLYLNETDGLGIHFVNVTAASGIVAPPSCRTILFNDYDGDGDADLYLGSHGTSSSSKLYLNEGDLNNDGVPDFKDVTAKAGVRHYAPDNGATAGDIDNDGDIDIVQAAGTGTGQIKLFRNDGDSDNDGIVNFTDISANSGIPNAAHHGVGLGDVDNDGDLDLADANFHSSPLEFYANNGDGTFTNITDQSGIGYLTYGVRTLFADIDNDGDLDLWMNKLFMNNTNNADYLKVLLLGEGLNRDAVGAKLRVWQAGVAHTAENLVAYREVTAGTAFFSSDDYMLELGLPAGEYDLEATFVGGTVQTLNAVNTGQTVNIPEGPSVIVPKPHWCRVMPVVIDIKPGSECNPINIDSKGVIPVALLTTDEFDAAAANPETLVFGPAGAKPVQFAMEDVDMDGDIDLILHYRTRDVGITLADTEAVLTGETYDGPGIVGSDNVRVLESKKGNK